MTSTAPTKMPDLTPRQAKALSFIALLFVTNLITFVFLYYTMVEKGYPWAIVLAFALVAVDYKTTSILMKAATSQN
jgi:hypothetical protein